MDIRNTRQLKDFSAGRLANAREGQKIILYFSLITIAVSAVATVVSYILSQQIAKTGGLGSMGVRSALTTAQMLLPIVQAVFLMCLELGYLSTMLRIARGQYASPNGMRLGFDRFWVLLRCTLLKGLIFGGVAMASMYVAIAIYMMTPLSNSVVDILMPLVKNAGTSGILLDDATYAQLMDAMMPAAVLSGVLSLALAAPVFYRYRMANYLIIDRPATGALAEGIEAQTRQSLENVKAILAQAGLTMESIVKTLVFLQDMNDFGKVNAIYAEYIHGDVLPARSCVEVAALPKGGLVEIEVIAKK